MHMSFIADFSGFAVLCVSQILFLISVFLSVIIKRYL